MTPTPFRYSSIHAANQHRRAHSSATLSSGLSERRLTSSTVHRTPRAFTRRSSTSRTCQSFRNNLGKPRKSFSDHSKSFLLNRRRTRNVEEAKIDQRGISERVQLRVQSNPAYHVLCHQSPVSSCTSTDF